MTQDEFSWKYRHILWGLMLEVSRTSATGSQRSILEDQVMRKLDGVLAAIWKEMTAEKPKETKK